MTDSMMPDDARQEASSWGLPTKPLSMALRLGDLKDVLLYAESTVRSVAEKYIRFPYISRQIDEGGLSSSLRVVVLERVMKRFDLSKYEDATDEEIQSEFVRRTQEALASYCKGLNERGKAKAQTAPRPAAGEEEMTTEEMNSMLDRIGGRLDGIARDLGVKAKPERPALRTAMPSAEMGLVRGLVAVLTESQLRSANIARGARDLLGAMSEEESKAETRDLAKAELQMSDAEAEAEAERVWQSLKAEEEALAKGYMQACKARARTARAALTVLIDCLKQAADRLGTEVRPDWGMAAVEAKGAGMRAKNKKASDIERATAYADEIAALTQQGLAVGRAIEFATARGAVAA